MKKIIRFSAIKDLIDTPKPAIGYVPEWYKKSKRFTNKTNKPSIDASGHTPAGLKLCVPFLDSMTAGYVAELWQDVYVTQTNDGPRFDWNIKEIDMVLTRDSNMTDPMPTPAGYHDTKFVWRNPYIIKTPPGYSVLITSPLNRPDLPFHTLSGIVDSDELMIYGYLPFFLEKGFEGIIPAGTPIFQIIPFKRDGWSSVRDEKLNEEARKYEFKTDRVITGWYKSSIWKRKKFD